VSLRNTDKDWDLLAETEPYWSVISSDQFKGGSLSRDDKATFFSSGEEYISDLFGFIHRFISDDFRPGRSLDFGCGVGRLLLPIARRSVQATGIDIAPGMLELCAENAKERSIENISLHLSDDDLTRIDGEFDFVNTYIVLQHVPPERGNRIFRRLQEVTRVGGVASLHVTYAKQRRLFPHEQGAARYYRRDGAALVDLGETTDTRKAGTITMFDYDMNLLMAYVSEHAGHPVAVLPTEHDGHLGAHFIYKRAR
jgi:SAM-dependent methyltransferase